MKRFLNTLPSQHRALLYEGSFTVPRALRGLAVQNRTAVPFLSTHDLGRLRAKSSTLFILGSGASLARLKDEEWDIVRGSTSFGFNFSLIHDHVPDLHGVETATERSEVGRRLLALVKEKLSPNTILLHSDSAMPSLRQIVGQEPAIVRFQKDLLKHFPVQFRMAIGSSPLARNGRELEEVLSRWWDWGFFNGDSLPFVLKYRGTLSMMVSLGIIARFRKIVICGVDLNHAKYFYQDEEKYPEWRDFRSSPAGPTHATQLDYPSACNMKEIVGGLNELALRANVELYIESPDSELSKVLPVFDWSLAKQEKVYED